MFSSRFNAMTTSRRRFGQLVAAALLVLLPLGQTQADEKTPDDAPLADGAFTLAVLPDTQKYFHGHPHHFHNQVQWIADNAERRNIKFALHLGDITDNNQPKQWELARDAMARLDGKVPYALATGNHDHGENGKATSRDTLLNDYFPFSEAQQRPGFGGAMEEGTLENTWHTFRAGDHDYLILALEWSPRDEAVAWANEIAAKHPKHRKILITHAYTYHDDTRYDWEKYNNKQGASPHAYGTAKLGDQVNDGEQLWQKLVSKHPGFILAINGHVGGDGLGLVTTPGIDGQPVHQMLVNYQKHKEGGEGYLRLLEFSTDGQTIKATSYSPSLDQFKTDEQNEFTLSLAAPAETLPAGAFTLAVLPDTQKYAKAHPQHFHNQTQWIADNAERRNIKFVLHLGDITDNNVPKQWEVARDSFARLDGKVPYALAPGNHDYGDNGRANKRTTLLNDYFSFEAAQQRPGFGGAMEAGKLENTWHTFRAGDHDYLILALEWSPRDKTVEWANEIAAKHPKHRKILITHAYMYYDETRYDWATKGKEQNWNPHAYGTAQNGGANDGEQLWQKLVSKHPGFILAINGHVLGDGQALLTSEGAEGQPVHQMLCNYQMNKEGGEGFMRLLEFSTDGNTIKATSYSPSLDQYKTDEANQFTLKLAAPVEAR